VIAETDDGARFIFDHPLPTLGSICCCPSRSKG
jgi:hypothetical protein